MLRSEFFRPPSYSTDPSQPADGNPYGTHWRKLLSLSAPSSVVIRDGLRIDFSIIYYDALFDFSSFAVVDCTALQTFIRLKQSALLHFSAVSLCRELPCIFSSLWQRTRYLPPYRIQLLNSHTSLYSKGFIFNLKKDTIAEINYQELPQCSATGRI